MSVCQTCRKNHYCSKPCGLLKRENKQLLDKLVNEKLAPYLVTKITKGGPYEQ